jgi:hypothetical protein
MTFNSEPMIHQDKIKKDGMTVVTAYKNYPRNGYLLSY